jgi:hypothetical protein
MSSLKKRREDCSIELVDHMPGDREMCLSRFLIGDLPGSHGDRDEVVRVPVTRQMGRDMGIGIDSAPPPIRSSAQEPSFRS